MTPTTGTATKTSRLGRWAGFVVPVATVLIVGSACSSSSKPAPAAAPVAPGTSSASSASASAAGASPAAGAGAMVEVKNFSFAPMQLNVAVGTTVTWKFDDSAPHTVSAADKSFMSPDLSNGKTFQYTFKKAGTFSYICSIHQYMAGTVTVT